MDRQDFEILEELLDTVEQLQQQRTGIAPKRSYRSLSWKLRLDVSDFADNCRRGEIKGRTRKRQSNELFRRIVAIHPDVWK